MRQRGQSHQPCGAPAAGTSGGNASCPGWQWQLKAAGKHFETCCLAGALQRGLLQQADHMHAAAQLCLMPGQRKAVGNNCCRCLDHAQTLRPQALQRRSCIWRSSMGTLQAAHVAGRLRLPPCRCTTIQTAPSWRGTCLTACHLLSRCAWPVSGAERQQGDHRRPVPCPLGAVWAVMHLPASKCRCSAPPALPYGGSAAAHDQCTSHAVCVDMDPA